MDDRPIGVFDSGFGGLTVARAMIDLLPDEDIVYVGDTGRYPYGPRPLEEVRVFARQLDQLSEGAVAVGAHPGGSECHGAFNNRVGRVQR